MSSLRRGHSSFFFFTLPTLLIAELNCLFRGQPWNTFLLFV
nr:MAG TPA: hypothetical protein [Caudoviricetes sp.]